MRSFGTNPVKVTLARPAARFFQVFHIHRAAAHPDKTGLRKFFRQVQEQVCAAARVKVTCAEHGGGSRQAKDAAGRLGIGERAISLEVHSIRGGDCLSIRQVQSVPQCFGDGQQAFASGKHQEEPQPERPNTSRGKVVQFQHGWNPSQQAEGSRLQRPGIDQVCAQAARTPDGLPREQAAVA